MPSLYRAFVISCMRLRRCCPLMHPFAPKFSLKQPCLRDTTTDSQRHSYRRIKIYFVSFVIDAELDFQRIAENKMNDRVDRSKLRECSLWRFSLGRAVPEIRSIEDLAQWDRVAHRGAISRRALIGRNLRTLVTR